MQACGLAAGELSPRLTVMGFIRASRLSSQGHLRFLHARRRRRDSFGSKIRLMPSREQ